MNNNSSIVFLTLSFVCIWVILDSIYGKKYLHIFLANVFPFYFVYEDDRPFYEKEQKTFAEVFNEKGVKMNG